MTLPKKLAEVHSALKAPAQTRFFLFCGPDESGSRALAQDLARAAGADAERVTLTSAELKADPARLADEAASISMFGGARYIVVDPATDEAAPAVTWLLDAPAAGNAVALIGGALGKASALVKLAADPAAIGWVSYLPDQEKADALVMAQARTLGLHLDRDVAARIARSCGANRAIIAQELEKLALYLDATPHAPKRIDHETVDAVGASAEEGDFTRLIHAVLDGRPDALDAELLRLRAEGVQGIPVLRALQRRLALLAELRSQVTGARGAAAAVNAAGRKVFWKERDATIGHVAHWQPRTLARAVARLSEAEFDVKSSAGAGDRAADEALFALCRAAARR